LNRTERDATRVVRSWLEEGADRIPDRVLDAVEAQLPANPQRRAGWLSRRLSMLNRRNVGFGLAAAIVVGAAAFGVASIGPLNVGTKPPIPEAETLPLESKVLEPGFYALEGFPARLVSDVPDGFVPCGMSEAERGICPAGEGARAAALGVMVVENVVQEPCSDVLRDPPPASLDELVAAISSLEGFEATPAVDVSIDGVAGKQFVVTAPGRLRCQYLTWSGAERINGVGVGEVNELTILDIDGSFLMVALAHFPTDPPRESLAVLREVAESIRVDR
jgi:hypothetical protein